MRGSAPEVDGLRILSDHQFRTLSAIARTEIPRGGPFEHGADDADLARAFDAFLADEPDSVQSDLANALLLVEFGPLIFDRKLKTFSNLSDDERRAHWQAWRESPTLLRRQVALAFHKFLCLVFYDDPRAWPAIGYPGPSLQALSK